MHASKAKRVDRLKLIALTSLTGMTLLERVDDFTLSLEPPPDAAPL